MNVPSLCNTTDPYAGSWVTVYVNESPSGSLATTFPVTAPVWSSGVPTTGAPTAGG
jgi:hypothetical protein